jgi:asparagine synthase (glutamine-hydrolysing)
MVAILAHRGPDDEGIWEAHLANGTWVGLGSRRLAILDLSAAGHMPMTTPDGRHTIVYNGEIYNYPQLRPMLEARGHRFRSNSDTEAILYLYQDEGADCVKRLNGMFAFAIWDHEAQDLFLARDHFGIKPLYYCHDGARLIFASEIKSLLVHQDLPRQINLSALQQYMTLLWVPDPLTLFDGILKLPPGYSALYRQGNLHLTRYWDLEMPAADHRFAQSEAELAEELRLRFTQTVKAQMLSDVPLGAFLSAGLDSSSIVAAMAQASNQPLRTFTISFPDDYRVGEIMLDNPAVAQRTAQQFGCIHSTNY